MISLNQTSRNKAALEEIQSLNNEILEPTIDPTEWHKEVSRVKDQLNFKLTDTLSGV